MQATLTSKGQITLPKPIRDRFRLHAGDKLVFFMQDDEHVQMLPKRRSIRELKGMAPPPVTGVTLDRMEEAIAEGACENDRA